MLLILSFSPEVFVVSNHFPTGNPTQTLLHYHVFHYPFFFPLIIVLGVAESERMLPGSQCNSWHCIWKTKREHPGFGFWFGEAEGGRMVEFFLSRTVILYCSLLAVFLLHRKVCDQKLCDGWLGLSAWHNLESPDKRDSMRDGLCWVGLWICL